MAREAGSLCHRPVCSGAFILDKSSSLLFISRHSALRWESKDGCCGTRFFLCSFGVDVCGVEGLYKGEKRKGV